ncbi:MAG: hypothetical protein Q9227_005216 [Pyrenula ochraceoflavens]
MEANNEDPPVPPPDAPTTPDPPKRKGKTEPPQTTMDKFWERFMTKYPGKVLEVLPKDARTRTRSAEKSDEMKSTEAKTQIAFQIYEEARDECTKTVERIIKECRRINQKWRDPYFDIENDLKLSQRDFLDGLCEPSTSLQPRGVKRVTEIFENPQFFVNGASATDVRQGRDGDCWVMAALASLGCKDGLIDRICVKQDVDVGVYGFVFNRDGEWVPTIVDDKLYLAYADYTESFEEKMLWNQIDRKDSEEEYRKAYLTGSRALYFAACSDENETWLPLLEKAYAKAHGDFGAIDGGITGEAIEDFTGGVNNEVISSDILDKEKFWKDELLQVNKDFLFSASTGHLSDWLDTGRSRSDAFSVKGIINRHAYSVVEAREIEGKKLLKVRNPWGKSEWTGAWSDGSAEWTSEWMTKLNHTFGNDGVFWISYKDFLQKYSSLDRTRLFDSSWSTVQKWTTLEVPWKTTNYHSTKFTINVAAAQTPVVIVLSQLDWRYFRGLEGQYWFAMDFVLRKQEGAIEDDDDYIVQTHGLWADRSVSTDVTLMAGTYDVPVRISASRNSNADAPDDVVKRIAASDMKRGKLVQIGNLYDQAHAKGRIMETEEEKKAKKEREARKKKSERAKLREETEKSMRKAWSKDKKLASREKRAKKKAERAEARREEKKAAAAAKEIRTALPEGENKDTASKEVGDVGSSDTAKQETETSKDTGKEENQEKEKDKPDESSVDSKDSMVIISPDQSSSKPEASTSTTIEPTETKAPSSTTDPTQLNVEPTAALSNLAPTSAAEATSLAVSQAAALTATALNTLLDSQNPAPPSAAFAAPLDDETSSTNSFRDFEFDSEIDMPSDSEDDGDDSSKPNGNKDKDEEGDSKPNGQDESAEEEEEGEDSDDDDDEESDPWNAVCVVGLRVYSQDKELAVDVVIPLEEDEEGDSGRRDKDDDGLLLLEGKKQRDEDRQRPGK